MNTKTLFLSQLMVICIASFTYSMQEDTCISPDKLQELNKKLSKAVKRGNAKKIEALIAQGACVNDQPDTTTFPPLCNAIKKKNLVKIALLVKKGADITRETARKKPNGSVSLIFSGNPLVYALRHYNIDAIKTMLYTIPEKTIIAYKKDQQAIIQAHLAFIQKALNTKVKTYSKNNSMGWREETPYVLIHNQQRVPQDKSRTCKALCELLDPENLGQHKEPVAQAVAAALHQ